MRKFGALAIGLSLLISCGSAQQTQALLEQSADDTHVIPGRTAILLATCQNNDARQGRNQPSNLKVFGQLSQATLKFEHITLDGVEPLEGFPASTTFNAAFSGFAEVDRGVFASTDDMEMFHIFADGSLNFRSKVKPSAKIRSVNFNLSAASVLIVVEGNSGERFPSYSARGCTFETRALKYF